MASARAYFKGRIPEKQMFRGQAALIIQAMKSSINATTAKTTVQIAKEIEPQLQTRQDPERVVAFYMSVWKKKGWVRSIDVAASDSVAAASEAAESAPNSAQDEVGGISADDHNAAQLEADVEEAHEVRTLGDLRGMKLSQAVEEVIKFHNAPATAEDVVKVLNDNGYEFQLNQVQSALQNLVKKERVVRDSANVFTLAATTAA